MALITSDRVPLEEASSALVRKTEGKRIFYRVVVRQQLRSGPFPRDKKLKRKWLEVGEAVEALEERKSGEGLSIRIAHAEQQWVIDPASGEPVPDARRSGWVDTAAKGKRLLNRSWQVRVCVCWVCVCL